MNLLSYSLLTRTLFPEGLPLECFMSYNETNDWRKIICLRKSEVPVSNSIVAMVTDLWYHLTLFERSMAYDVCHAPLKL